jgi:uncharacterized membrane protein
MNPQELSNRLRTGRSRSLARRRGIAGLSLLAAGSMGVIALYQMGIIRHLPEPPLPHLDADKVDASAEAYEMLSTPDAFLGLASYAGTAVLAAMGEPQRAQTRPWLPLTMAGKVAFDAAQAAKLSWDQWAKHRAFCSWCLLAAGATFAMLPPAFSEARSAIRELLSGRRPASNVHAPARRRTVSAGA